MFLSKVKVLIMSIIGSLAVAAILVFVSALTVSCGKSETVYINQVQERPLSRVALINAVSPRSMLRVTCGRGGALLSYFGPDEVDTVNCSLGDTLVAIYNSGSSKLYFVTESTDTLWRIR